MKKKIAICLEVYVVTEEDSRPLSLSMKREAKEIPTFSTNSSNSNHLIQFWLQSKGN